MLWEIKYTICSHCTAHGSLTYIVACVLIQYIFCGPVLGRVLVLMYDIWCDILLWEYLLASVALVHAPMVLCIFDS